MTTNPTCDWCGLPLYRTRSACRDTVVHKGSARAICNGPMHSRDARWPNDHGFWGENIMTMRSRFSAYVPEFGKDKYGNPQYKAIEIAGGQEAKARINWIVYDLGRRRGHHLRPHEILKFIEDWTKGNCRGNNTAT